MPNCIKCNQPQSAALVICPECYRALTERTVSMDDKLLIKDLRRNGLGNGTALGHHNGLCDIAADRIEELTAQLRSKDKFIDWVHSEFAGYMPTAYFERLEELRGPQEAGEVEHEQ